MTGGIYEKKGKYYAVLNLCDENGKRIKKWIPTGLDVKNNKRRAEAFLQEKIMLLKNSIVLETTHLILTLLSVKELLKKLLWLLFP